ncbi:MAG: hypothetical protein MPJ24_00315 [Pirellulaceae bacterium]|nr:hypothetical protein [Pirellulaceae bacterium]
MGLTILVFLLAPLVVNGQESQDDKKSSTTATERKDDKKDQGPQRSLTQRQASVTKKFGDLEKKILRMADLDRFENPGRASLLRDVYTQSKEEKIALELAALVHLVESKQYKRAVSNQKETHKKLQRLLELLSSEAGNRKLKEEQARVREYIKELERIGRLQKAAKAQTKSGGNTEDLAEKQGDIAGRTKDLNNKIGEAEEGIVTPEGKEGEGKEGEGKKGEGKKGEGKKGEGKSRQQGEPGQQSDGQGQKSGKPPGKYDSAQKRIEAAREKMKQAQKKLDEAKKDQATEDQEEAEAELDQAIAELEEILRQLREEEIERLLAQLEVRFTKMLQMQIEVYESTERLSLLAETMLEPELRVQSRKLGLKERKIVLEAEKTLSLLYEEGSSLAFPETLLQIKDDMQQVSDRLNEAKVQTITQQIELDIIDYLKESIAALQKAQKDQKKRNDKSKTPPPSQSDSKQNPPLVDQLAELKMVRAMEKRIKARTDRYADLLEDKEDLVGQAKSQDLKEAIQKLGTRQEKIRKVTRDIVLGKNQ